MLVCNKKIIMLNFKVNEEDKMEIKIFTVHPDYKKLELHDKIYFLDLLYDWVNNEKIKTNAQDNTLD